MIQNIIVFLSFFLWFCLWSGQVCPSSFWAYQVHPNPAGRTERWGADGRLRLRPRPDRKRSRGSWLVQAGIGGVSAERGSSHQPMTTSEHHPPPTVCPQAALHVPAAADPSDRGLVWSITGAMQETKWCWRTRLSLVFPLSCSSLTVLFSICVAGAYEFRM